MADDYKRQIAYKVNASIINSSKYVRKDGWDPNYIVVNGKEVSSKEAVRPYDQYGKYKFLVYKFG